MKNIEIGAAVHSSRRGKPIAVMMSEGQRQQTAVKAAPARIKDCRNRIAEKAIISHEDILRYRDGGRK